MSLITDKNVENETVLKSILKNSTNNIPMLGSIISSLTYGSSPVPVIRSFDDVLEGLQSLLTGKKKKTKIKGAVKVFGALGSVLGGPGSSQLAQIINDILTESGSSSKTGIDMSGYKKITTDDSSSKMDWNKYKNMR